MVQAAVLGGQFFDLFSLFDDGGVASKVGVSWSYVADALVVALGVVVLDEGAELGLESTGQILVLQPRPVLEGLVPALVPAPGLGVERGHRTSQPQFCALDADGGQCVKNT